MLNQIAQLSAFLTSGQKSSEEIGKFITDETLRSLTLINSYLWRLDNDGKLRYIGGYLKHALVQESWDPIDISIDLPLTDCIRSQEVVWLNGSEEWESQYESMKMFKLPSEFKTLIQIPLRIEGHPIACWGISSSSDIKQTPEIYSTLIAISGMISLYAKNMVEFKVALEQGVSRKLLSRRQNKILDLIKEKLINREIGEELGYSESTIRQETMRIYRILGVGNRRGASTFKFIED